MKLIVLIVSIFLAVTLSGAVAFAEPNRDLVHCAFESLDSTADGFLSPDEFSSVSANFTDVDVNTDGRISYGEFYYAVEQGDIDPAAHCAVS